MSDVLDEMVEEIYYGLAKHLELMYERDDPEYVTAYQLLEEAEDKDIIGGIVDTRLRIGDDW